LYSHITLTFHASFKWHALCSVYEYGYESRSDVKYNTFAGAGLKNRRTYWQYK